MDISELPTESPVYTLFFQHHFQKMRCSLEIRDNDGPCLYFPQGTSEKYLDEKLRGSRLVIAIHSPQLLTHYNIFAFVGFIPPGGANEKILRLRHQTMLEKPFVDETLCILETPSSNAKGALKRRDFGGNFDASCLTEMRYETNEGKAMVQQMYFQVLALPKGDARMCIMTFRDKSLEPRYHLVRSLPNGITVELASSY